MGTARTALYRYFDADGPPNPKGGLVEQLLHLDGKTTVTLNFSDSPTADLYRWIAVYANLKADSLEKSRPGPDAEKTSAAEAEAAQSAAS